MKQILLIGFLGFLLSGCGPSAQNNNDENNTENNNTELAEATVNDAKVQVYYFHGKMRCETCINVQKVAHEAILEHFTDNKDVAFHEVDFSQSENEALAEKYEVVFSSLIIADNNGYKDITDQSFAMANSDPEGLKALIAAETNAFLTN